MKKVSHSHNGYDIFISIENNSLAVASNFGSVWKLRSTTATTTPIFCSFVSLLFFSLKCPLWKNRRRTSLRRRRRDSIGVHFNIFRVRVAILRRRRRRRRSGLRSVPGRRHRVGDWVGAALLARTRRPRTVRRAAAGPALGTRRPASGFGFGLRVRSRWCGSGARSRLGPRARARPRRTLALRSGNKNGIDQNCAIFDGDIWLDMTLLQV